jgi:hypothetical protein
MKDAPVILIIASDQLITPDGIPQQNVVIVSPLPIMEIHLKLNLAQLPTNLFILFKCVVVSTRKLVSQVLMNGKIQIIPAC